MQTELTSILALLSRSGLLPEQSPHSAQFQSLTRRLLAVFSAAAVIPPLSPQEIEQYACLALLHDIGKSAIPSEILHKPGSLTPEEFAIMKTHTVQGCRLLEGISELRGSGAFPLICDVCRHHHERWDGSGYPDQLSGPAITPWVHVVGLADAFDALTHPRVYKPAYPPERAGAMVASGACGCFNPAMQACFAEHIGEIYQSVRQEAPDG